MQPASSQQSSGLRSVWALLTALFALGGLACALFSGLPYTTLRSVADRLAADGSLELFSAALYARLRPLSAAAAVLLLLLTLAMLISRRQSLAALAAIPGGIRAYFRALPADARASLAWIKASLRLPAVGLTLLALTLAALLTRIWFIHLPFQHDESYNFVVFAIKPLRIALSDYHFPNNHLFQTLLMHFSYLLFGAQDWSVRLPAFLAGVLSAPAAYALARRWYGPVTALLSGMALAVSPIMVSYSVTARGYSIIALFTLMLFLLGTRLREGNRRLAWLGVIVVSALGFYTIPIFLYPFGVWLVWMGLNSLRSTPEYPALQRLVNLALASAAAAVLTLLLYLPVFRYSGVGAVFANQWVAPVSRADFLPTLLVRLPEIWAEWNSAVPPAGQALLAAGFLLSLIAPVRQGRLPAQIGLLFIALIFAVQRPNPWPRTFLFLLPLLMIWASAGWVFAAQKLSQRFARLQRWERPAAGAALAALALFGLFTTLARNPAQAAQPGALEQSVQIIAARIAPEQIVVATAPDEAPVWYYLKKYAFADQVLLRNVPFTRAYVIIDESLGQTIQSVIAERGPDDVFFDYASAETLFTRDSIRLVQIDANLTALEREYPGWQP
jgi:hypothetical protein